MDGDGDCVGLALPGVDGGGHDHAFGQAMLFGEPVGHCLGVVNGLVAGGEDGDAGVAAGGAAVVYLDAYRIARVVVAGVVQGEAGGEELAEPVFDDGEQGRVDVGCIGRCEAGQLDERGDTGGDLLPDVGSVAGAIAEFDSAVSDCGDAVQGFPCAVEGVPQVGLMGRRGPV